LAAGDGKEEPHESRQSSCIGHSFDAMLQSDEDVAARDRSVHGPFAEEALDEG